MLKAFPNIDRDGSKDGEDHNPAIQLLGRRFFADQTIPELLIEFLLVAVSPKRIYKKNLSEVELLPELEQLRTWPPNSPLEYAPKARLNLKLFAFLGASKLETRHASHRQHYRDLIKEMRAPNRLSHSESLDANEILKTLENLFLGFQGVGGQRAWCAAGFLPITRELIAGESIWRVTRARAEHVTGWDQAVDYFTHSQRAFLARGGELLYLQVCNALRQDEKLLQEWAHTTGLSLSLQETNPTNLHASLQDALSSVLDACPETVGKLAEFLDTGADPNTAKQTDFRGDTQQRRYAACGWCPEECWPEGLLFAVELSRICKAVIDPIERLEMLELACAMQVLRSLCAQSARYGTQPGRGTIGTGPLGYVWALSDPGGDQAVVKQISRRNLNAVQRLIHDAVRHPVIRNGLGNRIESELTDIYREVDDRYGHKLFVTVAKRVGLVVPKRGAGARFVLNDKLLRFLVLATLPPGVRVTYESFKKLLLAHYGLAVDDEGVARACEWSGTARLTTLGGSIDGWLLNMLDAAGVLIHLSDSCSLVTNPFDAGEESA